jgi:hypothetical protein
MKEERMKEESTGERFLIVGDNTAINASQACINMHGVGTTQVDPHQEENQLLRAVCEAINEDQFVGVVISADVSPVLLWHVLKRADALGKRAVVLVEEPRAYSSRVDLGKNIVFLRYDTDKRGMEHLLSMIIVLTTMPSEDFFKMIQTGRLVVGDWVQEVKAV